MKTKPNESAEKTASKQRGRPFLKGVSGNPAGRPEGTFSLLTLLKRELQKCPEGQDKKTYADLIIKRMLNEAIIKGDVQQIKLIWNYIEGMPKGSIDVSGTPQINIQINKKILNIITQTEIEIQKQLASEMQE